MCTTWTSCGPVETKFLADRLDEDHDGKITTQEFAKVATQDEAKKVDYISKYLPQIGIAIQEILELSDMQTTRAVNKLEDVLERSRKH